MFVVNLLVVVLFVEIQCLECSAYKNEQSCNFKGTLPCKWNDSVTSGSKCKGFICSYATTQTECENNGVIPCYWNGSATDPCKNPACTYFPSENCVTLGTTYGVDCYQSGAYCLTKGCSFYDTEDKCKTDSAAAGFKCKWGSFCSDRSCFDKDGVATKEECETYDIASGGSCKYTAADGATPSDCAPASCSGWSAEGEAACLANNGKLDCVWNGSASNANYKCTEKSCGFFKSESDCDANAAKYSCSWYSSILYGSGCWSLTCGDLDSSKQTCEEEHPACHYSGSCKEGGDAASVVGVSGALSMLILLLLAFNFF